MADLDLGRYASLLIAAAVLGACVCRIDMMRRGEHRATWFVVYALFAVLALGVALDQVMRHWVDWYETAGLVGVLLYMWETRGLWQTHAPPETETGDLRHADGRPADGE